MQKSLAALLVSFLCLSVSPLTFADNHVNSQQQYHTDHDDHDDHRQHGAHVHGKVEFHIAQEGNELLIELHAPSYDLMGFETAPQTAEQKVVYQRALSLLSQPEKLFSLNKAAQCHLEELDVEDSVGEQSQGSHSEFSAEYHYECAAIDKVTSIEYQWFGVFPATKSISAVALTDKGAKTVELNASNNQFVF